MMRTAALVVATDSPARGAFAPAWAHLAGRPVCAWALDTLAAEPAIVDIALAAPEWRRDQAAALVASSGWARVRVVPVPRTTVGLSAQVSLAYAPNANTPEMFLLHDGARPLFPPTVLQALLRTASARQVAMAAVPVKETIKWVDDTGLVRATPPRAALWQAITPIVLARAAVTELLATATAVCSTPASARESPPDLARWVMQFTNWPIQLVQAGHDNVVVRRRADLAALANLPQG